MVATLDQESAARALIDMSRVLYDRGWMEGTGGNLSLRLAGAQDMAVITASGRSKGELTAEDCVHVHATTGRPLHERAPRPSAETDVHAALYRVLPGVGAVAHVHSPYATLAATHAATPTARGRVLRVEGLELAKVLLTRAATLLEVPVFENWPDVSRLGCEVAARIGGEGSGPPVLLVAGHGATAWGRTLAEARDRLECLEALCRLRLMADLLLAGRGPR